MDTETDTPSEPSISPGAVQRSKGPPIAALAVVALSVGVAAFLYMEKQRNVAELKAKTAIESLKGLPVMDAGGTHVVTLNLQLVKDPDSIAKAMGYVKDLRHLQVLDLSKTPATDADLKHVAGLSGLTSLHLNGTNLTDAGLAAIGGLRDLQGLHIADTKVTSAGLAQVSRLKNLLQLDLSHTEVAKGLAKIAPLDRLEWLLLRGVQLDEEALEPLANMKGLKRLTVGEEITLLPAVEKFARENRRINVD